MLSGRPLALVILAWAFIKVLVKQLLGRPRPGLPQFRANYDGEGLLPLDRAERELLPRVSGCLACGRCDLGEGERIAASNGQYPGPMQLVLASSRSMPDYAAAARGFALVPDSALKKKATSCPAAVPFVELKAFVTRRAGKA